MEKGPDGKYNLGEPVGEIKDGKFVGYLQKADERPDLAIWDDDSKSYKFGLKKEGNVVDANGKPVISEKTGKEIKQSDITALYNPYWHSSNSALNDQFTSAYKRPNLVTVECEILADEAGSGINLKMLRYNAAKALKQQGVTAKTVGKDEYERRIDEMVDEARTNHTGPYWAEKANASIGRHDWHTGTVAKDLPIGEKRSVYLTRELLPVRIMSTEETADKIISQLGKNLNKSGAYNAQVFPPQLAKALEERGMKLSHGVDDDCIRYSRGPRHPNPNPGNYMDKEETAKDKYLRNFSDRYDPIRTVVVEAVRRAERGGREKRFTRASRGDLIESNIRSNLKHSEIYNKDDTYHFAYSTQQNEIAFYKDKGDLTFDIMMRRPLTEKGIREVESYAREYRNDKNGETFDSSIQEARLAMRSRGMDHRNSAAGRNAEGGNGSLDVGQPGDGSRGDNQEGDGSVRYSRVVDKDELSRLEKGPVKKFNRSAIASKFGSLSPKATTINGKLNDPHEIGTWYISDEHSELLGKKASLD